MLIYLVTIPVDNGRRQPGAQPRRRRCSPSTSTDALQQLWAFIVFPLIGALVGVILFLMLDEARLEDTLLADIPGLTEARNVLEHGADDVFERGSGAGEAVGSLQGEPETQLPD